MLDNSGHPGQNLPQLANVDGDAQPEIANLLPLWIWSVVFLIYFGKAGPLGLRVSEKTGEELGLKKLQKF